MSDLKKPGLPTWKPVDINADTDFNRRRIVTGLASCLTGLALSSRSNAQATSFCVLTPDSGEGPFYFDPDLLRSDIREDAVGAPLTISIQVVRQRDCAFLEGARCDIWHADGVGLYSGYSSQPGVPGVSSESAVGRTFLRGTQFTDAEGKLNFQTIYPSWYQNRTPHIHFKIFPGQNEVIASQIYFPDEYNEQVFEQWQPYSEHVHKRGVFNENDIFLTTDPIGGVFCDIEAREEGFQAAVVIAVAET